LSIIELTKKGENHQRHERERGGSETSNKTKGEKRRWRNNFRARSITKVLAEVGLVSSDCYGGKEKVREKFRANGKESKSEPNKRRRSSDDWQKRERQGDLGV